MIRFLNALGEVVAFNPHHIGAVTPAANLPQGRSRKPPVPCSTIHASGLRIVVIGSVDAVTTLIGKHR